MLTQVFQIRSKEKARLENKGTQYLNEQRLRLLPGFLCTAGQDPSLMNDKDYLKAFAKGLCSPTVVIPGLMSTKMVVELDCPVFREHHPKIFRECGFTHCKKKWWDVRQLSNQKYKINCWSKSITEVHYLTRLLQVSGLIFVKL